MLAPRMSPAWGAVAEVLRQLADAEVLPGDQDILVQLPMAVMARPVPGTGLAVAYVAAPETITPIALVHIA
jgi:hypothetical protein